MQPNPILKKLGFSDTDRLVILHTDDIGMCQASVAAFIDLWEAEAISSGAIMIPCPWAKKRLQIIARGTRAWTWVCTPPSRPSGRTTAGLRFPRGEASAPAEVPVTMSDFKAQQYRWVKGKAQVIREAPARYLGSAPPARGENPRAVRPAEYFCRVQRLAPRPLQRAPDVHRLEATGVLPVPGLRFVRALQPDHRSVVCADRAQHVHGRGPHRAARRS